MTHSPLAQKQGVDRHFNVQLNKNSHHAPSVMAVFVFDALFSER
jgi:hypothetical protein